MANPLEVLADSVVRREADQDVRGRILAFDRLASAIREVPRTKDNRNTQQVALSLIRAARQRHGENR